MFISKGVFATVEAYISVNMVTVTAFCFELFIFVTVFCKLTGIVCGLLSWRMTDISAFELVKLLSQNEMMYVGRCRQLCRHYPAACAVTNVSV